MHACTEFNWITEIADSEVVNRTTTGIIAQTDIVNQ